jgi:predicted GTPase
MPTRQICGCLITPALDPALQMDVDFLKDMKAAAGRSPSAVDSRRLCVSETTANERLFRI